MKIKDFTKETLDEFVRAKELETSFAADPFRDRCAIRLIRLAFDLGKELDEMTMEDVAYDGVLMCGVKTDDVYGSIVSVAQSMLRGEPESVLGDDCERHYIRQCDEHRNMPFSSYCVWVGGEMWSKVAVRFHVDGSGETIDFDFSERNRYSDYFVLSSAPFFTGDGVRLDIRVRKPKYGYLRYAGIFEMCMDSGNPYFHLYEGKIGGMSHIGIIAAALNEMWFIPRKGSGNIARVTSFRSLPDAVVIDGREMKFGEFAESYNFLYGNSRMEKRVLEDGLENTAD